MIRGLAAILVLILFSTEGRSQNIVTRNDSVLVLHGTDTLELAWATGINSAHFSEMDINLDGIMDLLVLEPNNESTKAAGDKLYPFINDGTANASNYRYAPEYREFFPPMENFVVGRDYNCDGKVDIFYRDNLFGTVGVYRNDSDTSLKFTLMATTIKIDTSELKYPHLWFQDEIVWMYGDLLGFEDVDGDGDIDIVSSNTDGYYLQYNKNMSMEYYGVCDSLVYKLKNTCWGQFFEDFGKVQLFSCDTSNVYNPERKGRASNDGSSKSGSMHSRNSILPIDLDGDGDKDLIAGDLMRRTLYQYTNGGKFDSSIMVSYQTSYPKPDTANVINFAMPFYVDVDNDGVKDLMVSVDNDQYQDFNSVWFYKNAGSNTTPNFQLKSKSFLQEEMIDVGKQSKPIFFDYNGDSLQDLLIGNKGYLQDLVFIPSTIEYLSGLALYENIGSAYDPKFKLVDRDYGGLSNINLDLSKNAPTYGIHPTLGDLDGDGDEDLIVGDFKGKLHYFRNDPIGGKANFVLVSAEFDNIDVGDWATPHLYDLDDDGLLDLIIGEQVGYIHYYRNTGSNPLHFELMDKKLGNINVNESWDFGGGYSSPFFFTDSIGELFLLSGSKRGNIRMYDSIMVADTLSSQFHLVVGRYQNMWDGLFSTVHGSDLNYDGSLDFILGNQSGGLALYTSEDSIYIPPNNVEQYENNVGWKIYPNPTKDNINVLIDCDCSDVFTYSMYSALGHLILEKTDGPRTEFSVSGLEDGIYFIRVVNKNRSINITERFIKMK